MLTKFSVTNFKNFRETITFDLTQSKNYEFNLECVKDKVINKALIYGHNGIGKSNIGFAIFDLVSHLTDKNPGKESYKHYTNAYSNKNIAKFSYEFLLDSGNVTYEYGKKDAETLIYETIYINSKEYAHVDRTKDSIARFHAKGAENLQKDIGESKISILSYIRKNTLLEDNLDNKCFSELIDFINGMLFFRSLENNNYIGFEQGSSLIDEDIIERGNVEDFQSFLNEAGIKCKLAVIDDGLTKSLAFDFQGKLLSFFDIASQGTKSLSLFYFWYQRFKDTKSKVTFLFIDEFDAFYHHSLAALIVERLREIKSQVIITTHNVSIMTNDLLRPDCYFLMNSTGISSLADRTAKELRLAHNIEKMYRAGKFSG